MSGAPDPAAAGALDEARAGAEAAAREEPPVRVNPRGRWVTTPEGERIFLLDPPRPAAPVPQPRPAPPSAAAPARTADAPPAPPASAAPPRSAHATPAPAATPATAPTAWSSEDAEEGDAFPELQGEGLQEIIAHVPALAVRWGAGVIAAVVAALIVLSAVVRYPEVVRGSATITTPTPPVRVAAASGGEIQELPAADNQQVRAGEVVAVLRSSARWRDVRWVHAALDGAAPGAAVAAPGRALQLGDVQGAWDQYQDAVAQYGAWASDPYVQARLEGMRAQVGDQRRLGVESERRVELMEREGALADRDAERSRELVTRQLLSPSEAERTEATALSKRQSLASARGDVVGQRLRVSELEGQILEMEQSRRTDRSRLQLDVQKAWSALAEAVRLWETRYLLVAPIAGRVSHFRTLSAGQYLNPGEPVLALVPAGGEASSTVLVADASAGRVRPGQTVLISFASFPATEFGKVEARVRAVALVPAPPAAGDQKGAPTYRVALELPRGLRTSSGRTLPLRQEMTGDAEIVTDDLTVLQRLLAQVRGASTPGGAQ